MGGFVLLLLGCSDHVGGVAMRQDSIREGIGDRRLALVQRACKDWTNQLIDLTGRNQLLYYRTLKRGTLELTHAAPGPLDALLTSQTVRLTQLMPPTETAPVRVEESLQRAQTLHRKALALYEERGVQTLYLAWGMATWKSTTSAATPAAPVLLRPLEFRPRGAAETDFDVVLQGDWDVNATLLHLLRTEYKVDITGDELLDTVGVGNGAEPPEPTRLYERLCKEAADVPSFRVVSRIVVGTFAYTKLPMVRDIEQHVDAMARNELVAAIAGDEQARAAVKGRQARDVDPRLPDRTPPADEYLILDADASQNHAINAAIAGESLIVHGPPGTGKSQTIANLVAAMAARGKRVLFVAEKRAAIEAVVKRLDQVGLGDLVLDLHGGVTSKKLIVQELAETIGRIGRIAEPDLADLHDTLARNRHRLNDHVAALHDIREPWGLSLWQVTERLMALPADATTSVRWVGTALAELHTRAVRDVRDLLQQWADLAAPLRTAATVWAAEKVRSEQDAERVWGLVTSLTHDAPTVTDHLAQVSSDTGLPAPANIAAWQPALDLLAAVQTTTARAGSSLWDEDLAELESALTPGSRPAWPRAMAQLFDGNYRRAKKLVKAHWQADTKPTGPQLHGLVSAAYAQMTQWADLGGEGSPRVPAALSDAARAYDRLMGQLTELDSYLAVGDLRAHHHHADVAGRIGRLADGQAALFRLPRVHAIEERLSRYHCAALLQLVRDGRLGANQLARAFEHAWLSSIRAHLQLVDPRVAAFDGRMQSRAVAAYADADRGHVQSTPARVRRTVAERAVHARDKHPSQDQLVLAQSKRKRGHLPLRQLFAEAPDVLTALRPCWVMSPLVVSQTLPPDAVFDIVVFDEASQVVPADAVPALLRAPQAVVAGDDRQLPPTAFFGLIRDDEEDDDEEDEPARLTRGYESILDVSEALLRTYMLTWHYRSQDERLIAFSNQHIYAGALTTFPGVSGPQCLQHQLVPHRPGVRVDSRSNGDEVTEVIDLMIDHARSRPEESLGVIAMGQHHAARLEAALHARLAEYADSDIEAFFDESRPERAFIKNLERVQGDERDAIILTSGYAKTPDGRLLFRFGPLIAQGGERRLNVAITRARKRMTVVSSFSHTDMDPGRSRSEGAKLLRGFLKYVETGGVELEGSEAAAPLNAFELAVLRRLEKAGLRVVPQYGTSGFRIDFAVCQPEQPGRMVLAVEADGASYHSTPTARDRDRLRQQVLERLGWRVHRIWSTDWFSDPDKETERVLSAYRKALAGGRAPAPARRADTPLRPTAEGAPARRGRRPNVHRGGLITDYRHDQLVALARWIQSDTLLRTEEQLLAEMMSELGFKKRGKRIVAALSRAIADSRSASVVSR